MHDPLAADAPRRVPGPMVDRRTLLVGATAAAALAACGGGSTGDSLDEAGAGTDGAFTLVQRFPNNVLAPGLVRLPITLSTGAAEFISDGPATLTARVVDATGTPIGEAISAVRRDVSPAPYYDFRTDVDTPGVYGLVVDGGPADGAAFQVMESGQIAVPGPGDELPGFDTPTVDDDQGLAAICTRQPEPCPFHDVTLTEALASGRPVAYLVGTPAFCSTGSCGPALDALIQLRDRYADTFAIVHAEVFTDDAGTAIAPAVTAVGMTYEPALFLTDADGVVVERLDAVWNGDELAERLAVVADGGRQVTEPRKQPRNDDDPRRSAPVDVVGPLDGARRRSSTVTRRTGRTRTNASRSGW